MVISVMECRGICMNLILSVILVFSSCVLSSRGDSDGIKPFAHHFKDCHRNSANFDKCIRNSLNRITSYFHEGLPEYGVTSFDPFYIEEVSTKRGGPGVNYVIKLRNVYESGWNKSTVTKFKSALSENRVKYSQLFPVKKLTGDYEIETRVMGLTVKNNGSFNLTLVNYTQTTVASRRLVDHDASDAATLGALKVRIEADTCQDMELHISNLVGGSILMERFVDRIINLSWRPGFNMARPVINDLVSKAFTKIFNDALHSFPFDQIIT